MERKIKIIGLTGGLASGKTTVARIFKRFGAKIIDADAIAHRALHKNSANYKKITKLFGGPINRQRLAQIVFSDSKKRRQLERIIHPFVKKEIKKEILSAKKHKVIVVDAPLLFETKLNQQMDYNIVVWCNKNTQIKRACKKWGCTRADALARIKAQMPLGRKRSLADLTINNTSLKGDLKRQTKKIFRELTCT